MGKLQNNINYIKTLQHKNAAISLYTNVSVLVVKVHFVTLNTFKTYNTVGKTRTTWDQRNHWSTRRQGTKRLDNTQNYLNSMSDSNKCIKWWLFIYIISCVRCNMYLTCVLLRSFCVSQGKTGPKGQKEPPGPMGPIVNKFFTFFYLRLIIF